MIVATDTSRPEWTGQCSVASVQSGNQLESAALVLSASRVTFCSWVLQVLRQAFSFESGTLKLRVRLKKQLCFVQESYTKDFQCIQTRQHSVYSRVIYSEVSLKCQVCSKKQLCFAHKYNKCYIEAFRAFEEGEGQDESRRWGWYSLVVWLQYACWFLWCFSHCFKIMALMAESVVKENGGWV